jgi:hypothetical protein
MTPDPLSLALRRVIAMLLAAWVVVLAATLLAPSATGPTWLIESVSAVGKAIGVPAALTVPERIEFVLNAAAFAPVSLLGTLLWPWWTWRDWTAVGFVASFSVEGFQAVFLSARSATYVDVVSNTAGALGGAVIALALSPLLVRVGAGSEGGADLPHRAPPAQQDELPG